jgi:fumarate hydratase class II
MPQIQIKDALGNVQTAAKVTNTGRTSHTDSMPVTLSNEDFA